MAYTDITKDTVNYTVAKKDTFSHIAQQCIKVGMSGYSGLSLYNDGINKLKSFNPDVENIDLIYVGQKLILQGTAAKKTTTKAQRAKITAFGLQSNTDEDNPTVYATWSWNREHTEEYKIRWKYGTGDGVGWVHEDSTTTYKYSTCSGVPENATHVTFQVKPISKTYKKNDKETHYWTADWSTKQTYWFKNNPPKTPPIDKLTHVVSDAKTNKDLPSVTVKLSGLEKDSNSGLWLNATHIQFQFLKNGTTNFRNSLVKLYESKDGTVSYNCSLTQGDEFKVRCRSFRGKSLGEGKWSESQGVYSDWSDYTTEAFGTAPAATKGIHTLYVRSKEASGASMVRVGWYSSTDDKGILGNTRENTYSIGYATDPEYFISNENYIVIEEVKNGSNYTDIRIDTTGVKYYFAVRVSNSAGTGLWSEATELIIGEKPATPTTWSSSASVMLGEQAILYWAHQTVDGSPESFAKLDIELSNNGSTYIPLTINENGEYTERIGDDYIEIEKEKNEWGQVISTTSSYSLTVPDDGPYFKNGAKIRWRVKTAGVFTDSNGTLLYSEDWSNYRYIDVYAKPSIRLDATFKEGNNIIDLGLSPLPHFPITVVVTSETNVNLQKPISYYVSVTSVFDYETVDSIGNVKMVKAGDAVFSRHFDTNDTVVSFELGAGDIDLENGQEYVLACQVAMDSGLTGFDSIPFSVEWSDDELWPNLEITYDELNYTTMLCPYCDDGTENPVLESNVTLSVYRREFDGTFTELATDLNNEDETYITDPHPSLDYARYRVVARSENTGAVSFYDVPGFPINEKAIIIQWDEEWKEFDVNEEFEPEGQPWVGSLLRLPYNVDISDSHSPEVEMVKYIGRENPVSYYGTQIGHTSTWSVAIPKSDTETLYAIRRLSRWIGDVYVREPSGSGYWANITVMYKQTHLDLTIPITFSVTRVEEK